MTFSGSPWWLLAWAFGIALIFWRAYLDRQRGLTGLLPAYISEGLALTLLILVLLKPGVETQTYSFTRPKVILAVDASLSFDAGKTLALQDTVALGMQQVREALSERGLEVETWSFAERPLATLQEKLAMAGPEIMAAFYWGDGRDSLGEGRYAKPFYPVRMGLGDMRDVQAEKASWLREGETITGLLLQWMPIGLIGLQNQSGQSHQSNKAEKSIAAGEACLHNGQQVLHCWPLQVDPLALTSTPWQVQSTVLEMNAATAAQLKKEDSSKKSWNLIVRSLPDGRWIENDTLVLSAPKAQGKTLCWPKPVRTLDETAILRLLASDSIGLRFVEMGGACGEALKLEILPPSAARPGAGYRYFEDTSSIRYSPEARRFLPPALGRLADLSATGLWLPDESKVPNCLLAAVSQGQAGCLVGLTQESVFYALPSVWSRLFRETGDPALARRISHLSRGVVALAEMQSAQAGTGDTSGVGAIAKTGLGGGGETTSRHGEMARLGIDIAKLGALAKSSGGSWLPSARDLRDTVTFKFLQGNASRDEIGFTAKARKELPFSAWIFLLCAGLLFYAWYARSRRFAG